MNPDLRILIIDDKRPNLDLVEQLLVREGLTNVLSSTQPLRTLELFNSFELDLVILDLHMPEFDGFAVLGQRTSSAKHWLRWKPCCASGTCWKPACFTRPCAPWCQRIKSICCKGAVQSHQTE